MVCRSLCGVMFLACRDGQHVEAAAACLVSSASTASRLSCLLGGWGTRVLGLALAFGEPVAQDCVVSG